MDLHRSSGSLPPEKSVRAPGWPGIVPRWTSSAKSGIGTALGPASRVWFTLSHGILNEIYYPRVDQACTRDCGLLVTDGDTLFSEEKRDTISNVRLLHDGVPAYRLTNRCRDGRYLITKDVIADPGRDVILQRIEFRAMQRRTSPYHLYVLLAPHISNRGTGNTAWLGVYKGIPMLFAGRDGTVLALACSSSWLARSVGFVGVSDGWQDLKRHKRMQWSYTLAENGNVALTGEIDLQATGGSFEIAIGFGRNESEAGQRALTSLHAGFAPALETYIAQWSEWFASLEHPVDGDGKGWLSTAVIRAHEDKEFRGGIIASLSIPWGQAKGDDDLGGYHLVWVRDLVEAAGGLLAAGATDDVRRVLEYLRATQEADGHWPQNMWLDGDPFWPGIQMDEAAFPVLLLDLACREKVLDAASLRSFMPMVRRAAGYIVRNGPVTGQDRWEEDAGYAPFTLAVEIAALVVAANFLEDAGELVPAGYLRETALYWNACIERWCYVQGSDTARQLGIDGYYVRIAPPEVGEASSPAQGFVPIKNRPANESIAPASRIISTDALALVRFGLRAPDDPRILNTVRAIDRLLMVETPSGPAWHRYNQDGYGEHEDGRPFDGTGIGRAWPLLTGERAHYELRAGNVKRARDLLAALSSFGSEVGLLPEQTWDAKDIPERELFVGRPAGSAMPLVWAHAEHVKLLRSLSDGRVFDAPSDEVGKLFRSCRPPAWVPWRFNNKCREIPEGKDLRIELPGTALVRWTSDHWQTVREVPTRTTTLGIEYCDIPTGSLSAVSTTEFTFLWTEGDRWEGRDYSVLIRPPHPNE